jgi:hypothetical protein
MRRVHLVRGGERGGGRTDVGFEGRTCAPLKMRSKPPICTCGGALLSVRWREIQERDEERKEERQRETERVTETERRERERSLRGTSSPVERDETCPVSTEGWTRRVHFVREGRGGGRGDLVARALLLEVDHVQQVVQHPALELREGRGVSN